MKILIFKVTRFLRVVTKDFASYFFNITVLKIKKVVIYHIHDCYIKIHWKYLLKKTRNLNKLLVFIFHLEYFNKIAQTVNLQIND